ncbi:MAG TPA: TIGR03668 family PPOX class F420-dependent oxidoreductase [Blastocatellia bacterium]|nr:TIGR03668 family PPOX class F420-dependent oxidoreductase [Blastocatellia bacterium]
MEIDDTTREFIRNHRVARLATANADSRPAVVPICYAIDGDFIYSPVDEKPKRVAPAELKRVRNIRANPKVSLVIDDYSEDWSKLVYVIIAGQAETISPEENGGEHARAVALLREKYEQYRSMAIDERLIIKITIKSVKRWDANKPTTKEESL